MLCLGVVLLLGNVPNAPVQQKAYAQTRTTLFLPLATATCLPRLAFTQLDENNNGSLYTMNGDGANKQRLTDSATYDSNPAWSPDGQRIAFSSSRTFQGQIFVMNADGSGTQQLTTSSNNFSPVWSPDGTRIAFVSDRGPTGMYDIDYIYTMNSDGTNIQRLTNSSAGNERDPAWSPQNIIAFSAFGKGGYSAINTINGNASGGEPRLLIGSSSDHGIGQSRPVWSPDGRRIAFVKYGRNAATIATMQPDGSNIVDLMSSSDGIKELHWSPDGQYIAFTSTRFGNVAQIFRMNADGSNVVQLTQGAPSMQPSWNPRLACAVP